MASGIRIRPVQEGDLEAVSAIHAHYILNSVAIFYDEPLPLSQFLADYKTAVEANLPYLVVIEESTNALLGYAKAQVFRPRAAYRFTVEISIFCHPEHQGRGVGSSLLKSILAVLEKPEEYPGLRLAPDQPGRSIKQVMAIMTFDDQGKDGGMALKEFYQKHGFELRGQLVKVGYKSGRWLDTMYMQKSFS
ncbi:acyl-CoA N-acyltransferase [Thozetella sp. PMI_491]|nr:acyl-CoA N-acyltransferase [Thozetella sp. PMI_491]